MSSAASLALRPLLARPVTSATVLGSFPSALYLALDDDGADVVAVVRRGGVALPNALVVDGVLPRPGPAAVGDGLVRVGAWTAAPDRWWDPRPDPGVRRPSRYVGDQSTNPRLEAAVARLVGCGAGLTPAGDDSVAGLVATLVALGDPLAAPLTAALLPLLPRTTALSAALLRHASRGEMAAPAARYLEALCGRGAVEPALRSLLAVGHTSGADLARGIDLGHRLASWRRAA